MTYGVLHCRDQALYLSAGHAAKIAVLHQYPRKVGHALDGSLVKPLLRGHSSAQARKIAAYRPHRIVAQGHIAALIVTQAYGGVSDSLLQADAPVVPDVSGLAVSEPQVAFRCFYCGILKGFYYLCSIFKLLNSVLVSMGLTPGKPFESFFFVYIPPGSRCLSSL